MMRHTFHCDNYVDFLLGGIHDCFGDFRDLQSFRVPVDFFELLSTKLAACSKPLSKDHGKVFCPKMQQHDQAAS